MKINLFLYSILALLSSEILGSYDYSICYVHIGNKIPSHLEHAVAQARLFNKDCPIYVLLNKNLCEHFTQVFAPLNVSLIELEGLPCSAEHEHFLKQHAMNPEHNPFWRFTTERFLYIYDLMVHYNLEHLFHLENDNMLYVDLQELFPMLSQHPSPIAATFDNDNRVIAGFIYIRNLLSMQKLAKFLADRAALKSNDMMLLAQFKYDPEGCIGHLPIIMEDYTADHPLVNALGSRVRNPSDYCQQAKYNQSIFDAAAIGQFLGGGDLSHHPNTLPGFINESCVFNPSLLNYIWELDAFGRRVPYAVYKNKKYRINNLHIHSKQLHLFKSKDAL
jgi:hypothetical protein